MENGGVALTSYR